MLSKGSRSKRSLVLICVLRLEGKSQRAAFSILLFCSSGWAKLTNLLCTLTKLSIEGSCITAKVVVKLLKSTKTSELFTCLNSTSIRQTTTTQEPYQWSSIAKEKTEPTLPTRNSNNQSKISSANSVPTSNPNPPKPKNPNYT